MRGRPPKNIDQKEFEKLCGLQCTRDEICGWFGITDKTLSKWCKRTYGEDFSAIFAQKRGVGKIALRRMQWKLAEKNPSMAIFLGKNLLGQSDHIRVESRADGKLADLIDGLKEPITDDLYEEATGADGLVADEPPETNQSA